MTIDSAVIIAKAKLAEYEKLCAQEDKALKELEAKLYERREHWHVAYTLRNSEIERISELERDRTYDYE